LDLTYAPASARVCLGWRRTPWRAVAAVEIVGEVGAVEDEDVDEEIWS